MRAPIAKAMLLCAALTGCEMESMSEERRAAAPMAAPPTQIAVGPIPGPARPVLTKAIENPLADDPGAAQEGRRLFVAFNCSGCHGGRAGGGMGPSLRDEEWLYGDSDAHVFDSIAAGRANGMPAWGALLPASEMWKLVAYIHSLRTPSEPNAPDRTPE